MSSSSKESIINWFDTPMSEVIYHKLKSVRYNDISEETDPQEFQGPIHTSVEVTLEFENGITISVSWVSEKCWPQYVLGCRSKPFYDAKTEVNLSDHFEWQELIGTQLKSYKVYGNTSIEFLNTDAKSKANTSEAYDLVPHLLELNFENGSVYLANFYYEEDLVPKLDLGDDIWITFSNELKESWCSEFKYDAIWPK